MVAALAFADCIHGYTYIYVGVYRYVLYFEQVTDEKNLWEECIT
jgi:hypothetical protein